MDRIAFYPGSFDPFTNGHLAILRAGLDIADKVVIGIGVHSSKAGMLPHEERERLIALSISDEHRKRVSITRFSNLVVDAARDAGANLLLRGLRNATDLDYEMQMAGMNARMSPDLRTIFVPAEPDTGHITATLVRQIAAMGGDISPFVPEPVAMAAVSLRDTKQGKSP